MAMNPQNVLSQLRMMDDQQLQQYAAMHKNDPYIMALALSESNRRKQMREGAQMAAPEQPKVVDQEIANMAAPMPEDVGIAQLPMNNPGYASGGIDCRDGFSCGLHQHAVFEHGVVLGLLWCQGNLTHHGDDRR